MKSVLVVEDDTMLREMYKRLLQTQNYSVLCAVDGESGLEMALNHRPDVILLDLEMGKVGGFELLEKLRENEWGKQAKVIIFTNHDANDEALLKVMQYQPIYYLMKASVSPTQILEKIEEALH
jgi:DNA-binding response OmpR family regulator